MQRRVAIACVFVLLIVPYLSTLVPTTGERGRGEQKDLLIDSFSNGERTITLNLTESKYYSTKAKFSIPNNSTIHNATFRITAFPNERGSYPKWIKLDVGDDGTSDWMFRGRGYGSFGNQTVFSDDTKEKFVQLSSPGWDTSVKFYLPRNATIDSATMTVEGRRNIISVTRRWSSYTWGPYEPFSGSYYNAMRFQTVFPRSAINRAGYIDKIYFNVVSFPSTTPRYNNFKVYLANTTKSSLSSTFSSNYHGNLVLVYSVSSFRPTNQNGWIPIDIDDIFYFNNTENLLVEIRWSGDNGQNIRMGFGYGSPNRPTVYASSTTATSGSTTTYKYNFKIDFLGEFPHNAVVDFGNDGVKELTVPGKFNTTHVFDLKDTLINLLNNPPDLKKDDYGNDLVPVVINLSSDTQGAFLLRDLRVYYSYIATVDKVDNGRLVNVIRSLVPSWPNEGTTIIPINVTIGGAGKIWLGDVKIAITLPNYPPEFRPIPSNFTLYEDTSVDRLIDLSKYVTDDLDPPESLLYLVQENTAKENLRVYISDGHYLGVDATYKENWNGVARVKVSATDSGGKYAFSNVFEITVLAVNDEPVATDKNFDQIFFDEDGPAKKIILDPHGSGYFYDVEGDRLYYHFEPITEGADNYLTWNIEMGDNNYTTITLKPLPDKNTEGIGPILFRLWADDDEEFNLTSNPHKDLEVFIESVPDPPKWAEIPALTIDEDSGKTLWFKLNDVLTDVDTPFDSLTVSVISVSTNRVRVTIENGTEVYLCPEKNFEGNGTATFRAQDDENTVQAVGEFHILPVNDPPVVKITAPEDGTEFSGIITITGTASDVDGEIQFIEVKIDNGDWMRRGVSGTTTWTFSTDSSTLTSGVHTIWVRAYDGEDFSTPVPVRIIVVSGSGGGGSAPPTVSITYPKNGDEVYGTIVIYGTANDDRGVVAVQIKIGDSDWINASVNETMWNYKWITTHLPETYDKEIPIVISVRAWDGTQFSEVVSVRVFVNNHDTDGDGLPNRWEEENGLDPYNPTDAQEDKDGDGYTNEEEYKAKTDPQDANSYPGKAKKKGLPLIWIALGVLVFVVLLAVLMVVRRKGEKEE
ncbi:MAG: hypothetical protein J7L88_00140, partial [Thermoplasmata archaeon]|nr:hypothetical protein [Thermoplasmata archaeon]